MIEQVGRKHWTNLCEWARIWGMTFNVKKCQIMHIGHRNPNYAYFMHSEKLAVVVEEKDRGVMVHRSLKPTRPVLWSRSRPFWPDSEP